jgi:putative endonuclease
LYMFYVYILRSLSADKFYVGQTNDVEDRLRRHNAGLENFTSKYCPWMLIGVVEKKTRAEAMELEKKLKNLSKERIIIFVQKHCHRSGGADEA